MEEHVIQELRKKQSLHPLPQGNEGVMVTLQFKGDVPAKGRPERKQWLVDHFNCVEKSLIDLPVKIDTQSVSVSGQTIEAVCDVNHLADLRAVVEPTGHRVDIMRTVQVVS